MTLAVSNRVQVAYIPETTFGVTPATPQTILLPMHSTSLDLAKQLISDPTIIADRMERYERHGNYQVAGNIVASLQHGQWDDFIEAAMGGTWATNVVKVGTTNRSFTIEQGFLDIAQYRQFTGVRVNTWDVSIQPNSVIQSTFGLIGSGMSTATTSLDVTPTPLANKQPLVHIGSTITVGGASVKATAITLQLNNNMTAQYGIGASAAIGVSQHMAQVSGSCTFYFEDMVAYNRFLNETSAAISVGLTDGTNTITIAIPNAKFNTATLPISGSSDLFVTMAFKGMYDGTSGSAMSVTRS